jgi:hypothetical protein
MGKFDAFPEKDFFIDMLTRDIQLERAIIDLIDNSVDGAKGALARRKAKSDNLSEFKVEITANKNVFQIQDNCGGFSKKSAEDYAFKFGRPENIKEEGKNVVGRFGVGMKRALFKIGEHFVVETKTDKDHFIVEEDVRKWSKEKTDWKFDFKDVNGPANAEIVHKPILKTPGTLIKITKIREAVKEDFELSTFITKLTNDIEKTLNYSLQKGFNITINTEKLKSNPIKLLISDEIKPYYLKESIGNVEVKIYAGISEPDPNNAGWYIFCNDRLMLEKDKTNLTGWEGSEKLFNDTGVQKYHNKVAMFRGIVFFTSNDPIALPMTTTKTGIDANSPIYKSVRLKMITAMKAVLSYLNKIETADERVEIVGKAKLEDINSYDAKKLKNEFKFPSLKKEKQSIDETKITFSANKKLVDEIKKIELVSTNTEVGLKTFDYYIRMKELKNGK